MQMKFLMIAVSNLPFLQVTMLTSWYISFQTIFYALSIIDKIHSHSIISSFSKYLLCHYYMLSTILGIRDIAQIPAFLELTYIKYSR